jgi:DNA topoisomerase-2
MLRDTTNARSSGKGSGKASGRATGSTRSIEQIYQKKTQLEHILLRPDAYVGSVEMHRQSMWVFNERQQNLVFRDVRYVPGLYKIFDEILVNAADNKQRDPSMTAIKVTIDKKDGLVTVWNDGKGIPVQMHKEHGMYVPEMIFSHLLTGSNFDDDEQKHTGGRNGYGAKLTNIFSSEFTVECSDAKAGKQFRQVFSQNMTHRGAPDVKSLSGKSGGDYTKISFRPDFNKFGMAGFDSDTLALFTKRVYDLAGVTDKSLKVYLNGSRVPVDSFQGYVKLCHHAQAAARADSGSDSDSSDSDGGGAKSKSKKKAVVPKATEVVFKAAGCEWEVGIAPSHSGSFNQVSFVNSISTTKGGSHVDYVTSQVTKHLIAVCKKKQKDADVRESHVKAHLCVYVNCLVANPSFDSQSKETLTTKPRTFGSGCELDAAFLKKVEKSGVVESVLAFGKFRQGEKLRKAGAAGTSRRDKITGIPKLDDANYAGCGARAQRCTLILTEGDSAKSLAVSGLGVVGRDYYGVFPLKGKLLNVRDAPTAQVLKNEEVQSLARILGLRFQTEYTDASKLRCEPRPHPHPCPCPPHTTRIHIAPALRSRVGVVRSCVAPFDTPCFRRLVPGMATSSS